MAQKDVLQLLKKKRRFMTAIDIAKTLRCTQASLNKQLNQLVKYKQVKTKTRKIVCGKQTYKRKVKHFKYRKMRKN